jgi:hypothetical protein
MTRRRGMRPWTVIGYAPCPYCHCWSLGVQANGKLVRHSIDFGSVEKVGPGTRYPSLKTTICKGSGLRVETNSTQP